MNRSLGIVAAALSLAAVIYGIRVATAHALYLQARYGLSGRDATVSMRMGGVDRLTAEADRDLRALAGKILTRCERAHGLYGFHYTFCELASTAALRAALTMPPGDKSRAELIESATTWCDAGLRLNPRSRPLRVRKTSLLELAGKKREAADYWREYTEWHFWDAENQLLLASLCGRCGKYEEALEAQRWWKMLSGQITR